MPPIGNQAGMRKISRSDDIVIKLFALSTCLPPYCAIVPGLCMLWRIATDGALRRNMRVVPLVGGMAGFVAILVLSTLLYGGGVSLLVCLGLVASMVAFVYVRAVITPKNVEFFIQTAMWGTIANVIIAIVQALTFDTAGGYRPTALFYNPNYYAMISGFVLVLALYQWLRGAANKPLIAASAAAAAMGLILSNSRTGMLSAAIGVLLVILWMKTRRGAMVFIVGMGVVAAVVVCFPQFLRLDEIGGSMGIRTQLWRLAWQGIKQRPILGQGAWPFVRIANGMAPLGETHAHNLLLELVLSSGMLGVTLLALYLYGNIRDVLRNRRTEGKNGFSTPALALFCMTLVHGIFDVTIFIPQTAVTLMILLGAAAPLKRARAQAEDQKEAVPPAEQP